MVVKDGYITGATATHHKRCGHCGERTLCIDIADVTFPRGVTVKATIMQDRNFDEPRAIKCIGIGCGDYAKFHRQLIWIQTSMGLRSGHAA